MPRHHHHRYQHCSHNVEGLADHFHRHHFQRPRMLHLLSLCQQVLALLDWLLVLTGPPLLGHSPILDQLLALPGPPLLGHYLLLRRPVQLEEGKSWRHHCP